MRFLMLSGSFRARSNSVAILNEIQRYFDTHDFQLPLLDQLPYYSDDFGENKPVEVVRLLEWAHHADGIIVCSPEYNHSIPAVLKNAIDWASRPAFKSVLKGKPVTIITQANSPVGGARAQAHLKLVFDSTLAVLHPFHEMMITSVDKVVDEEQRIADAKIKERIQRHISSFIDFAEKCSMK